MLSMSPACKHGVFETVLVNHGCHLHRGRGLHVFGEFGELANKVERFVRGLFAYHLNRESRMHQHVIAYDCLRSKVDGNGARDA